MFLEICIGLLTGVSACGALWALGAYIHAKATYEALWEYLKTKNIDKENE